MNFTFGICTYNSEKFIISLLESVKYQVINYGMNIFTYIIIADDGSNDNTVQLVEKWLKKNEELFAKILVLKSETNHGIAYNYTELMQNIETDYFKIIDGDDVLSSFNIYKQINMINDENMSVFFPLKFKGDRLFFEEVDIYNMIYYQNTNMNHKKDLHIIESYKPFITPEICFRRKKFNYGTLEFVRKFTQFEDDTSLYYIFRENTNMRLDFIFEPMVLYRIHDKSLSNGGTSAAQIKFLDDLHKFKNIVLKNEKNIAFKSLLFLNILDTFRMKHRFGIEISPYRYITDKISQKRKKAAIKFDQYKAYRDLADKYIHDQEIYLNEIKEKTVAFMNSIKEKTDNGDQL